MQHLSIGDSEVVEDAPIGYFRTHFCKGNGPVDKLRIFVTDLEHLGKLAIVFCRDKNPLKGKPFTRFLVMSAFMHKSVVLQDELWIKHAKNPLSTEDLLFMCLHFVKRNIRECLASDGDTATIRTKSSSLSGRTQRVSFLPLASILQQIDLTDREEIE